VCFDSFWFWDFFTSPHLLAELRDALLEGMDRSVKLPDGAQGLYIRRAGKRAVANDQEVTELLESYGIVPFAAEYMTFRQQVALAAQSRCIVGPHGAGLTLSLFMPDDSKLVELLPIGSLTECFGHIVSLLNLRYYSVPSVPKHPERESERVEPCLGILERTLLQEFGKRPVKSLATSAPQADEVEVGRMV
jgi:capsular polysaccharide biosynthesis protein